MRENLTSQQTTVSSVLYVYEMKPFSASHLPWYGVINLDYMSITQIYFSVLSPSNINVNFNLRLSYVQNFTWELCFNHHSELFHTCQTSCLFKVICFSTSLEMKWDVWFCLIRFHALLPPSYGLSANWSSFQLKPSIFVFFFKVFIPRDDFMRSELLKPSYRPLYLPNVRLLCDEETLFSFPDFIPFLTATFLFGLVLPTTFRIFKILIYSFKRVLVYFLCYQILKKKTLFVFSAVLFSSN